MEIGKVLISNYLPYAKGTIIDRALPCIDGLKPSHRKILYTMYGMRLIKGDKTKSTNIVGQTMQLHPHGDMSIYETLVHMTTGNETLNVPYIESKGNFGKVYSKDLAFAASRYTEAKLCPICEEMFDGIDEDAVPFQNNYDDTKQEPTLLPVKFPNILVNSSNGIAVGMSSNIPSFGLENVCNSVIGIIEGKIKDAYSLVDVLGIPQFTTGGNVHISRAMMAQIAETGKGSIVMTGTAVTYPDKIVITEIPYKVTSEAIVESIEKYAKSGELKEVSNVDDDTDLSGFKLTVNLKRGSNPQEVLQKLMRLTPLRSQISFNTKVIVGEECKSFGLLELLRNWIIFRMDCIDRVYKFRFNKASAKEHMLESWEKIQLNIKDIANLISNKGEAAAKKALMSGYKLTEDQADYILDMKIREFTQDRLAKHLKELNDTRSDMTGYKKVIDDRNEKFKIIKEDQLRIIAKYANKNKTHIADVIDFDKEREENLKPEIDSNKVSVVLTKSGYLRRLITLKDISTYELPEGESELTRFFARNNEYLLVFTFDGSVHKILVNSIDASRGKLKDYVPNIIGVDPKQVMFIDACGDYTRKFNVVYPNGRGYSVCYDSAIGKRSRYKGLFEESEPGKLWWTFEDSFFMVTAHRKAAYCDLSNTLRTSRAAFKVARVGTNDRIVGLQAAKDVPDITKIDLSKYNKEYTVSIGEDDLWTGAGEKYAKEMEERRVEALRKAEAKAKAKEEAKEARDAERRALALERAAEKKRQLEEAAATKGNIK